MKTTAQSDVVRQALANVNKANGYKLEFNRNPEGSNKWRHFTIKSASGIPGARFSHSGRKLASASWHAHGLLFDELFRLDPSAIVKVGGPNGDHTITKEGGNWEDCNVGSIVAPVQFSELSILSGKEDLPDRASTYVIQR